MHNNMQLGNSHILSIFFFDRALIPLWLTRSFLYHSSAAPDQNKTSIADFINFFNIITHCYCNTTLMSL